MDYGVSTFLIVFDGPTINREYNIDAERIDYKTGSVELSIRLDSTTADPIPISAKQAIEGSFRRFYVSCDQAATVKLIVSKSRGVRIESSQVDIDQIIAVEKTDTLTANAVSVGAAATLLRASDDGRKTILIQPVGAEIFVGGAGVTAATGLPVASGQTLTLDRFYGAVYAISGGGAVDTRVLSEGV